MKLPMTASSSLASSGSCVVELLSPPITIKCCTGHARGTATSRSGTSRPRPIKSQCSGARRNGQSFGISTGTSTTSPTSSSVLTDIAARTSGGSHSENRYAAGLETLRHQLASHSFLFVGFSLNDAHFSAQLRHVEQIYKGAAGPHYVLLSQGEAVILDRRDYQSIEVIAYEHHGLPLLAKLHELITAGGSMTGRSPRAKSSRPTTSPAGVSPEVEKPSTPRKKKSPSSGQRIFQSAFDE